MTTVTEIVLVDGAGSPRIFLVEDGLSVLPYVLYRSTWAQPRGMKRTVPITAWFERCAGNVLDGRPVFRQAACGTPRIRYEHLKQTPIVELPS